MKSSPYTSLPSRTRWKLDSALLIGARDPVLKTIDSLVGAAHEAPDGSQRVYSMFQLFFALDYWLGHHGSDPLMQKERLPAVQSLYRYVANALADAMGCTVSTLPNVLEEYYGRGLTAHGERIDSAGRAYRPDRARIERFRLCWDSRQKVFKHLRQHGAKFRMLPAESTFIRGMDKTMDGLKEGFANFVLTMGGDFYMAPHIETKRFGMHQSWFHSSYREGGSVLCAGSIRVIGGEVSGVQNNSGHYQPTDAHMVNVIHHLQMLGHPIENIEVWNYTGKVKTTSAKILAANGSWEGVVRMSRANFASWSRKIEAKSEKEDLLRRFYAGTSLRTLVTDRHRLQPSRPFHLVWDEVVLEIMSENRDYERHLGAFVGTPAKMGQAPPILSRPAIPKNRPWRT